MDPMNNPTPTPNPDPNVTSGPAPVPEANPVETPVAGAGEVPTASDDTMASFDSPVSANPAPVNPVINPGENSTPVNPVFQPGGNVGGFSATDPIMQPEAPTPPDPVEEELKAPMKAADPVPGSIGSAVSVPDEGEAAPEMPAENPFATPSQNPTPSVSFSDPTTEQAAASMQSTTGKKNNKMTLIILIVIAAMVVVALAAVLIIQIVNNSGDNSQTSSTPNNSTVIDDNDGEGEEELTAIPEVTNGTLSCTRNMTEAEIVKVNDAVSGTVNVSAEFADGEMTKISLVESVVYSDEDAAGNEPVETLVHESTAAELTPTSALNYYLNTAVDDGPDLTSAAVQANYEDLDFTCEVL